MEPVLSGGVRASMYALLFLALTFAPILAPCMVLGTAVALAVRVHRRQPVLVRHLPSVTTCALIAVLGSVLAINSGNLLGRAITQPSPRQGKGRNAWRPLRPQPPRRASRRLR